MPNRKTETWVRIGVIGAVVAIVSHYLNRRVGP